MTEAVRELHPESVTDALERWDRGESIFTIEMGGMGPGYEQALQIAMVELLRDLNGKELPKDKDELRKLLDDTLLPICKIFNLGLTGAQAGAVQNLAYQFLRRKWKEVVESVENDRRIQISNNWPGKK